MIPRNIVLPIFLINLLMNPISTLLTKKKKKKKIKKKKKKKKF